VDTGTRAPQIYPFSLESKHSQTFAQCVEEARVHPRRPGGRRRCRIREALSRIGFDSTMGKYRKRPVTVDAQRHEGSEPLRIRTLEGDMVAMPGDWIITGIKGERYPCRDDIFRATYEPIPD
jgi:hypothetical protein